MAYFSEWHKFLQNKEALVNDLKQALASPDDREMAFQLLAHMYPDVEILEPLLDEVLDTAIDSSNLMVIGLARQVLAKYRAEPSLRRAIPLFVRVTWLTRTNGSIDALRSCMMYWGMRKNLLVFSCTAKAVQT